MEKSASSETGLNPPEKNDVYDGIAPQATDYDYQEYLIAFQNGAYENEIEPWAPQAWKKSMNTLGHLSPEGFFEEMEHIRSFLTKTDEASDIDDLRSETGESVENILQKGDTEDAAD